MRASTSATRRIEPGGASISVVGIARDITTGGKSGVLFVDFETFEAGKRTRNPDAEVILPSSIRRRRRRRWFAGRRGGHRHQRDRLVWKALTATKPSTVRRASVRVPVSPSSRLFYFVVPLVTGLFFLIVTFQLASALTLLRAIGARHAGGVAVVQVFVDGHRFA